MALSKLGLKAAPPAIADDPEEPVVIDISGPGGYTYSSEDEDEDENEHEHEHEEDPDATLHIDAHGHGHGHPHGERERHRDRDGEREEEEEEDMTPPRGSDVTDMTDADITIVHPDSGRRSSSDSPEHDSTLYGSGSGSRSRSGTGTGTGAGAGETEHPLRLALHPPSPPPWDKDADGARRGDLESGRQVLDDDGDGDGDDDGDLGLGPGSGNGDGRRRGGRNGRASPQRFVFAGSKAQRMHGFGSGSKPRRCPQPAADTAFGVLLRAPPADSAYGTDPCGQIGVHHPREVVRVERDYTGGELPQFTPTYPLELEGRITPTQFLETINAINEVLLSAHSLSHAFVDNALAFFSLQLSRAVKKTHYDKEMERLHTLIDELNVQIYNPMGLHIRWPRSVAFLFLEIEYYVRAV
ncbi:Golgin subfamily A member 7/ERF4 family-domain-containing protein [Daedaleopsis nitida]|nr:Golgin subfamily A member 7/ERF4 family-domain-containing protein [Daedaleopsis nitida]